MKPLTPTQVAILSAIARGRTTIRAIMVDAQISSTSVVRHNLHELAAQELIVLEPSAAGLAIYDGRDYCAAWDVAARLAGNEVA